MPNESTPLPLPESPDLRHLKDQAKELVRSGTAPTHADALFTIARQYGFASWPRLRNHVESLQETGRLKQAIDANDLETVKRMMTRNPSLHRAPMGYGKNGPLTWVAECRIPWEPPGTTRLAMAQWMIDHGSDVHQGGDGPLMRAALVGHRIPMMDLLVANGADVNAHWDGRFPIIFAPCETVDAEALRWLLDHGADPSPFKARTRTRIGTRRWIMSSGRIRGRSSWGNASICCWRPDAGRDGVRRQCWKSCAAGRIGWGRCYRRIPHWCTAASRNWIGARRPIDG